MRSNSSIERSNPPPRRKSCAACVKAKRRCDLAYPRCSRCNLRDLECVYIGKPSRRQPSPSSGPSVRTAMPRAPSGAASLAVPLAHQALSSMQLNQPQQSHQALSYSSSSTSTGMTPSIFEYGVTKINNNPGMFGERTQEIIRFLQSSTRFHGLAMEPPQYTQYTPSTGLINADTLTTAATQASSSSRQAGFSAAEIAILDPTSMDTGLGEFPDDTFFNMEEIDSLVATHIAANSSRPLRPSTPQTPLASQAQGKSPEAYTPPSVSTVPMRWAPHERPSELLYTRLSYARKTIRNSPRTMVLNMETPWSHSLLYSENMPRIMEDALSSCALYMAKNEDNATIILRTIRARLHNVVRTPVPANTPLEALAKVQALLLYMIMCTFDGDLGLLTAVDEALPVLESWAMNLLRVMEENGLNNELRQTNPPWSMFPVGAAQEFWRHWIYMESAQRTFTMVFFFAQIIRMLKGATYVSSCTENKHYVTHVTVSAALWQAQDITSFVKEWSLERHIVVNHFLMSQVLGETRADNVGKFEKMILTALMGADQYKFWAASQGSLQVLD
ncbi:hypothetical protein BROUX41_003205 [Berkeleyomyces rouxiae]|uniref:uncharacterized protein n=1 Tax=Berkeleyomyces rouxiae TaxID=2035830 RepID=UPI003B7E8E5D